jgi:hypothetical protein
MKELEKNHLTTIFLSREHFLGNNITEIHGNLYGYFDAPEIN